MADSNNNYVIGYIASTIESMRNQMATKSDIVRVEDRIGAETTAIRGDIEQVQLRLDSMEHSIASRFENVEVEISRLRSAVYVLGKDRPDVLRLLGRQTS
jgi:hypothetical protein